MVLISLAYDPDKFSPDSLLYRTDLKKVFKNTGTFDSPSFTDIASAAVTAEIKMWAGTEASVPTGWLICDGAAISESTFADLFAAIAYEYGNPGGGNFNLPNFQGSNRFPRGATDDAGRGTTGGLASVTLTTAQLAVHTHIQNAHNHDITDPGHVHTIETDPGTAAANDSVRSNANASTTRETQSKVTGITIDNKTPTNQNAGSGSSHENQPPFVDVHFIIKT